MEKLKTYIEGMDDILKGGIPKPSTVLVAGVPGSGKSLFVLQTMMNNAKRGMKSVYFTTVSQPMPRILRYMSSFDFFDESLIGDRIQILDLGTALRGGNPREALERVIDVMENDGPDIIAIDSYKAIHNVLHEEEDRRMFTYDLAAHLSVQDITAFLVAEFSGDELNASPEAAAVDVIIDLNYEESNLRRLREIEVLKLRGSGFIAGRHFIEISPQKGITAYQRVGTVEEDEHIEEGGRIPSGVLGLDEMLGGGLPELSATIIQGGAGIGKTLLSLHFIQQAVKQGDHALILSFDERPAQLREEARAFGLDIERENVDIRYMNPVDIVPSKWLETARKAVTESGVKRVMIDSLSTLSLAMTSERHFRELIYTAVKMFRSLGVTLIMTMEVQEFLASTTGAGLALSEIADNVILMRYVELGSELKRAITVLKMRGAEHRLQLRELVISIKGMEVVGPFVARRGVLTGQVSDS